MIGKSGKKKDLKILNVYSVKNKPPQFTASKYFCITCKRKICLILFKTKTQKPYFLNKTMFSQNRQKTIIFKFDII